VCRYFAEAVQARLQHHFHEAMADFDGYADKAGAGYFLWFVGRIGM